jgi:hypothetical protein
MSSEFDLEEYEEIVGRRIRNVSLVFLALSITLVVWFLWVWVL